ncbi:hypothetical protein B1756_08640 [Natrarchaeobaculum aegyptiacum]|uniref:Protein-glutamine gamma-glutamyltransferase-like C-terminal domain-containing protein n=1 Tax=Natrarchaeobaculum aegyptiacum TaxID=745377 RepID=A0A2Z2HRK9_9EURY|nr:hypothetical protein B1756_08640 [Natrarchaeobaculum aegyptiacum]
MGEEPSGIGPDWGQVALVGLAVAILALTAVAAPALGGAGLGDAFDGVGDGAGDSSELPSLGEEGPPGGGDGGDEVGEGGGETDADGTDGGGAETSDADDGETGALPDDRRAGADSDEVGPEAGLEAQDADPESGEPGAEESEAAADGESVSDGADGDADAVDGEFDGGDGDDLEGAGDESDGSFDDGDTSGTADGGEADDPAFGDDGSGEGVDGDESMNADGDSGESDGDAGDAEADDGDGAADDSAADDSDEATFDVGDDDSDTTTSDDGTDDAGDGVDGDGGDDAAAGGEDESEAPADDERDLLEDGADGEAGASYGISVEDELTPGGEATVTVTEDGEPLEGATVFFDGDSVGTTDVDGRVTGTVPYTTELEVTIDPDGASQPSIVRGAGAPGSGGPQLSATTFDPGVTPQAANDTFEVTAETALEVDDPLVAGAETTVTATVNDVPIPEGTVLIAGEEVGTTDDDGTATVTVPESVADDGDADGDDEAQTTTVAVERDEIRAERVVPVRLLEVDVDSLLALPGRTVDVSVTDGDEPVDGATIALAAGGDADIDETGSAVTTTENGTASVDLPVAGAATIGASHDGATAETTVDGLYRNAAILGLVVVGAVALVARTVAGRVEVSRDAVRSLPARIVAFVASLGNRAVDAVVRLADGIARLGHWVATQSRSVLRALERAARWLIGLPRALADRGLVALAALDPRRLWRWLRATVAALLASSQDRLERVQSSRSGDGAGSTEGSTGGVDETVAARVRDLWAEFVRLVRPPSLRTKTPGEVGRYAVGKGLPERPVRTVVDAFRDVEYGRRAPDDERLERVRSAVDAVDSDGSEDLESDTGADSSIPPEAGESPFDRDATGGDES